MVVGLAVLLALPFLLWGDAFEAAFSQERVVDRLDASRGWAWLAGIGLLAADIVLPMPATVVMTALGMVYGALVGGLVAAAGSFSAGAIAYALCRAFGRGIARRVAGDDELRRAEALFASAGGWAVALSRWMPLLPEVVACLAGLARMPMGRFAAALACGSLPLGFTFAFVGSLNVERPRLVLILSAALPALLWIIVGRSLARLTTRRAVRTGARRAGARREESS